MRLSRTNAIASSGFPRRTASIARRYDTSARNHGPACRSTDAASSSRRSASAASPVDRATFAIPFSEFPIPHGIASARNPSTLRANRVAGGGRIAKGVFNVPEQMLSLRDHFRVAGVVGELEGAREPGACALEVSLRVPHHGRSDQRSRLGNGRKRRQVQNLFIPLKAFGRVPPDHPEVHQPPRDVGRFGGTTALDEPRQRAAVALEIITHAIQPFGLRGTDQPLRGEGGFVGAVARQPLQGVVALARLR